MPILSRAPMPLAGLILVLLCSGSPVSAQADEKPERSEAPDRDPDRDTARPEAERKADRRGKKRKQRRDRGGGRAEIPVNPAGRFFHFVDATPSQKFQTIQIVMSHAGPLLEKLAEGPATRLEIVGQLISPEPDPAVMEASLDRLNENARALVDEVVDLVFEIRGKYKKGQHDRLIRRVIDYRLDHPPRVGRKAKGLMARVRHRVSTMRRIGHEIGVSDAQKAQLKRIYIGASPQFIRAGAGALSSGLQAAAALVPYDTDPDDLRNHLNTMMDSIMELIHHGVEVCLDVRRVLTADQFEKFLARVDARYLLRPPALDRRPDRRSGGGGGGVARSGSGGGSGGGPGSWKRAFKRRLLRRER